MLVGVGKLAFRYYRLHEIEAANQPLLSNIRFPPDREPARHLVISLWSATGEFRRYRKRHSRS